MHAPIRELAVRTLFAAAIFSYPAFSQLPDKQADKTEAAIEIKTIRGNFKELQLAAKANHGTCLDCRERLNQECEKWGAYDLGISNAREWVTRAQEVNDAEQLSQARHALGKMLLLALTDKSNPKIAVEAEKDYAQILVSDPSDLSAHFDHGRALAWLQRNAEAHAEFAYVLQHDDPNHLDPYINVVAARRFLADTPLAAHRLLPPLRIKLQDGRLLNTEALKGHVFVLDFWASWCGACIASMPEFRNILAENSGVGIVPISISVDDSRSKWRGAIKKYNMLWSQALDEDASIHAPLGVHSVPRFILVDADGIVLYEGWNTGELSRSLAAIASWS
jgi:thiol-disulfide isomerase/thioredoxin